AYLVNNVELLFRTQIARAGQTDPSPEQVLGNASSVSLRPGIQRLRMHRLPYRTRFDSGAIEPRYEFVARAPELVLVDQKTTEPVRMAAIGRLGHQSHTRDIGKSVAITERDGAAHVDSAVENPKLAASDAGQYVAEPVVVSNFGVLVSETGIARLGGPEAGLFDKARAEARHEHPATGRGDDLVAVEREGREVSE